jgi:hypothetical protein
MTNEAAFVRAEPAVIEALTIWKNVWLPCCSRLDIADCAAIEPVSTRLINLLATACGVIDPLSRAVIALPAVPVGDKLPVRTALIDLNAEPVAAILAATANTEVRVKVPAGVTEPLVERLSSLATTPEGVKLPVYTAEVLRAKTAAAATEPDKGAVIARRVEPVEVMDPDRTALAERTRAPAPEMLPA